jgi:O-antigen/teichoic acid export membrane protein
VIGIAEKIRVAVLKPTPPLQNAIIYLVGSFLARVINFATFVVIARALSAGQVGSYQYAVSFTNIFLTALMLGSGQFLFRSFSDHDIDARQLMRLSFNLRFISYLLGTFALFLLQALEMVRVANVVWFALVWNGVEMGIIGLFSIYMRAKQRAGVETILQFLRSAIGLLVVIIFLEFQRTPQAVFLGLTCTALVFVPVYYFCIRPYSASEGGRSFTYSSLVQTLAPILLIDVLGMVIMEIGVIFLDLYGNSVEVARYAVGVKIVFPLAAVALALNTAYQPQIVALYSSRSPEWRRTAARFIGFSAIINLILSTGVFFFGPEMLRILYGEKFVSTQSLIPYLSFFLFLFSISSGLDVVLATLENWAKITASHFVGALVIIGANVILTPHIGALGATLSLLLSFVGKIIVQILFISRWRGLKGGFKEAYDVVRL